MTARKTSRKASRTGDRVKVVFLGAGSARFTRRLMVDLIRTEGMPPLDVVLHDIDAPLLDYMSRYCQMMVEAENADITVTPEPDRRRAFAGARFIIVTITIGGARSDDIDIQVPLKHGVFQTVGDTMGPGGLMRAFRSYLTYREFVDDMEAVCPDAVVINFSNPMTMVCRMLNRMTDMRVVGLCHGTKAVIQRLGEKILDIDPHEIEVTPAGVNHFIWFLSLSHEGRDLYPRLRRELLEKRKGKFDPVADELFRIYGLYPSPTGRHVGEFLPYYLDSKAKMERYGLEQRGRQSDDMRREGRAHCRDVARGKIPMPALKDNEFGKSEGAVPIILALSTGRETVQYANLPNRGHIPNLPNDVVVEVPARFGRKGVRGVKTGPLPDPIRAHVLRVIETQEMAVEASMTGDRDLALKALLSDCRIRDTAAAEKMLKEMFRRSKKWLGQFD